MVSKQSVVVGCRSTQFVILLVLLGWLTACGLRTRVVEKPVTMDAAMPAFKGAVWLNDHQFVGINDAEIHGNSAILGVFSTESDTWSSVALSDTTCIAEHYYALERINDHTVGMMRSCYTPDREQQFRIVSYDIDTQQQAVLSQAELKDSYDGQSMFAWSEPLQRAIHNSHPGDYGALYIVDENTAQPLDITLTLNGESWSLQKSVALLQEIENKNISYFPPTAWVKNPVWHPTEERIIFWGTLETLETPEKTPRYAAWTLFEADLRTLTVRALVTAPDATALDWSHDGKWIVYSAYDSSENSELVAYAPATGNRVVLDKGRFVDVEWAPDTYQLVAVKCENDTPFCTAGVLYTYDVRSVLE